VLERIEKEAGLRLEIVSGRREAELLLRNQPLDWHPESQHYLYVDVGGGSTELTLLRHGKVEASRSWPLGTVRLLAGAANSRLWQRMAHWLEDTCGSMRPLCVGSGGNINKLAALLRKDESETIAIWQVWEMLEKVQPMSLQQRMVRLGLRPDRADVFPHALRIYHHCMSAAGSTAILAPRMGLADALVREAWLDWKGKERRNGSATRRLARP
jgi:exopolyphosphatase/guanosine-5'-triphosphate,3'-diphosphate pyrophosphatase